MLIYLGIGDMPIYNFDKLLKTNNLSYMVVGWNEREEIEPPKEAEERWNDIYNEYCERTANNDALNYYTLSSEIGYLEMRYSAIYSLVYNLCEAYKKEIGRLINKWGVPFNIDGKIEPQMETLQRHLRIAEQNLKLKQRKLNEIKKNQEEGESLSLIQQKIKLERVLKLSIEIKKTTAEEWIELHKEAKEVLEQQKKVANG